MKAVIQPLALVWYESLLMGNRLVNRLQELGYRTALVNDLGQLVNQARTGKPLVIVAELANQTERVCAAVVELRQEPDTTHIPVLAYATPVNKRADKKRAGEVRAAGISLLANEGGLLTQLPDLLNQILQVD